MQGVQVQSLVRKLGSHMSHDMAKNNLKKEKKERKLPFTLVSLELAHLLFEYRPDLTLRSLPDNFVYLEFYHVILLLSYSLMSQFVKNLPTVQEMQA